MTHTRCSRRALLCRSTKQPRALQTRGGDGCRGDPVIGKLLLCAALVRGWVCLEGVSGVSAPSQLGFNWSVSSAPSLLSP